MTEILTKQQKNEKLKERIDIVREKLKSVPNWKTKLIQKHPQYNSLTGSSRIENTLRKLSLHDEELVSYLEEIANS